MKILSFWLMIMLAALSGCASDVQQQAKPSPVLELPDYFDGIVKAQGMVQDRGGKVRRLFTATLKGDWPTRDKGTLYEEFLFDDGEKQTRLWTWERTGQNTWKGTAPDVIGEAIGESSGNMVRLRYVMDVPVKKRLVRLSFDDRLYLQDNRLLLNKATMRKFGIRVGELTLVMEKDAIKRRAAN